ncbi:MAG: BRO family protein [Terasakiella sp.]|uniref:BRO family protein n=1 Tax=unclassified Terasakiella TaxID=2614952 RepID=UPI003B00D2F0
MTNALTFETTTLSVIEHEGCKWFSGTDIANALGYASTSKLINLYNRNKDEFSVDMSLILKLRTSGQIAPTKHRVFSLRGAHLISMFAKTPVAKQFRKWVLDLIEAHNEGKTVQVKSHLRRKPEQQSLPLMPKLIEGYAVFVIDGEQVLVDTAQCDIAPGSRCVVMGCNDREPLIRRVLEMKESRFFNRNGYIAFNSGMNPGIEEKREVRVIGKVIEVRH